MVPGLTDADKALLTEEELAGLLEEEEADEDEGGDDDAEVVAAAGDGDGKDKEDESAEGKDADADKDDGDDEGDGKELDLQSNEKIAADAAAALIAEAAAASEQEAAAAKVVEVADRAPSWVLPPEFDAKLTSLDEQRDAIVTNFDNGDLTAQEMRALLKPIEQQIDSLKEVKITASVERSAAIKNWREDTVPSFLEAHPEYKTGRLNSLLDAEVKRLQSGRANQLDANLLELAHETISGELRAALGMKADVPAVKPGAKPAAGAKPAKREVVPTLAHVPAADLSDADDGGEFAYLNRLADKNSIDFEKELSKLSPEKYDRYMQQ